MSTDKTQHYLLNQWEEDKVLRLDFNADNQIIDGALAALAEGQTQFICGSYRGTRVAGTAEYVLGARPKFLMLAVMSSKDKAHYCGLLAAEEFCLPFYSTTGMTGIADLVTFTDTGF